MRHRQLPRYRTCVRGRQISELFSDRITVFFSRKSKLSFNTAKGHWEDVPGSKHSSAGLGGWVSMLSTAGGTVFAHELGHFLQNRHTFGTQPKNAAEAAAAIRQYVEKGNDKADGANVFDGDARWVTDTPPDPGDDLFAAVHGTKCSPAATTGIAAVISEGDTPTVTSVGLGNVNGVALGYQNGTGQGEAKAEKDGDTYKISGTATGVDMANPMQPVNKPFEIEVTCP